MYIDDTNHSLQQQTGVQQQGSPPSVPSGSVQKEQEPLPSAAASFSELEVPPAEKSIEEEVPKSEYQHPVPQAVQQQLAQHVREVPAAQQNIIPAATHMQHALTNQQAQQKVKGSLLFKDSSDPVLWLALVLLRHYQLLEKEGKNEPQS